MAFNGPFVLFLLIAVLGLVSTLTFKNWIAKLILFLVTIGASTTTMSIVGLSAGWSWLITVILFLAVGITSVRIKQTGNRVLGIVLIILGLVLLLPAIDALGSDTPGTIWEAIVRSFQQGWETFMGVLGRTLGTT